MITFLKANMASLVASGCDFLMTVLLVQWCNAPVVPAAAAGTITGGVINFLIGRHWVFQAEDDRAVRQLFKYALVWTGNLLLNTGGVFLLASCAGFHYAASKVVTSLLVAFLYNYPLQKNFVFSNNW
ncbi:GtrA family protein [Paraflavitalea soli]|uniref:GtrA family protein n=1 Tax=Paraflavitalea soli TaxID=2315862 RepID=A0A3B7MJA4_9BACT|nr:GtrA family protein [Paraflavitalea soli]AXY74268.1 GtrA family protein [Paraflavitalea soli]